MSLCGKLISVAVSAVWSLCAWTVSFCSHAAYCVTFWNGLGSHVCWVTLRQAEKRGRFCCLVSVCLHPVCLHPGCFLTSMSSPNVLDRQIYFVAKRMCSPNHLYAKFILSPNLFCRQTYFVAKSILSSNLFCRQMYFVAKSILSPNLFRRQI